MELLLLAEIFAYFTQLKQFYDIQPRIWFKPCNSFLNCISSGSLPLTVWTLTNLTNQCNSKFGWKKIMFQIYICVRGLPFTAWTLTILTNQCKCKAKFRPAAFRLTFVMWSISRCTTHFRNLIFH